VLLGLSLSLGRLSMSAEKIFFELGRAYLFVFWGLFLVLVVVSGSVYRAL